MLERKQKALELQAEIDRDQILLGTKSLSLGFKWRNMDCQHYYAMLDCGTFEEYIDKFCDVGRSQVYQLIRDATQLEGSFSVDEILQMKACNATLIVEAWNDNVPERFRTPELLKAAHKMSKTMFLEHLKGLQPGLHLERRWGKTFQLSQSQHAILAHAVKKTKKETGATSDAQAIETMAQSVIFEGVKETPLDPVLSLVRKIEGIELSRKLAGSPTPTPEQWAEVVTLAEGLIAILINQTNTDQETENVAYAHIDNS